MDNYLTEYFGKKKERTEQGLVQAGLVKCNNCSHWIGKDFADNNGNCNGNCER